MGNKKQGKHANSTFKAILFPTKNVHPFMKEEVRCHFLHRGIYYMAKQVKLLLFP